MHGVICTPPDYTDGTGLKTYNEAMRCMETLGRAFTDPIVIFVLQARSCPRVLTSVHIHERTRERTHERTHERTPGSRQAHGVAQQRARMNE